MWLNFDHGVTRRVSAGHDRIWRGNVAVLGNPGGEISQLASFESWKFSVATILKQQNGRWNKGCDSKKEKRTQTKNVATVKKRKKKKKKKEQKHVTWRRLF